MSFLAGATLFRHFIFVPKFLERVVVIAVMHIYWNNFTANSTNYIRCLTQSHTRVALMLNPNQVTSGRPKCDFDPSLRNDIRNNKEEKLISHFIVEQDYTAFLLQNV